MKKALALSSPFFFSFSAPAPRMILPPIFPGNIGTRSSATAPLLWEGKKKPPGKRKIPVSLLKFSLPPIVYGRKTLFIPSATGKGKPSPWSPFL